MNGLHCLLLVLTFRVNKLENDHAREMVSIGNIVCDSLKLCICLCLLFIHIPQEGQIYWLRVSECPGKGSNSAIHFNITGLKFIHIPHPP